MPDTIQELFREWVFLTTIADKVLLSKKANTAEPIYAQRDKIEDRILQIPAVTAADLAVKFIIELGGDYGPQCQPWPEAWAIIHAAAPILEPRP